jgi:hypothetical protein
LQAGVGEPGGLGVFEALLEQFLDRQVAGRLAGLAGGPAKEVLLGMVVFVLQPVVLAGLKLAIPGVVFAARHLNNLSSEWVCSCGALILGATIEKFSLFHCGVLLASAQNGENKSGGFWLAPRYKRG